MTKMDKVNSWSIDDSFAKYALSQMNCFIPHSDIKEQILQKFLIPENLNCKKEMVSNIKYLLLEKKAKEYLSLDKAFCSMQEKVGNICGPLSQIWDFLEVQKNGAHEQISHILGNIRENVTEMFTTAKDCCCTMDIFIIIIGQAFNSLSYYECRNAPMAIMGDRMKVKVMMLENKYKIQENTSKRLFRRSI